MFRRLDKVCIMANLKVYDEGTHTWKRLANGGAGGGSGSGVPIVAAGGTSDAITATYTPAITLADTTLCAFVASGANTTTTPTFAPNSLTAHIITKQGGVALEVGDIPDALAVCILEYNLANTRWELLNPAVSGGGDVYGDATAVDGHYALFDADGYHVKDGGAPPTSGDISASGGTESDVGIYHMHVFTASDSLVVSNGGTMEYLVIGGGGGGGFQRGGGRAGERVTGASAQGGRICGTRRGKDRSAGERRAARGAGSHRPVASGSA